MANFDAEHFFHVLNQVRDRLIPVLTSNDGQACAQVLATVNAEREYLNGIVGQAREGSTIPRAVKCCWSKSSPHAWVFWVGLHFKQLVADQRTEVEQSATDVSSKMNEWRQMMMNGEELRGATEAAAPLAAPPPGASVGSPPIAAPAPSPAPAPAPVPACATAPAPAPARATAPAPAPSPARLAARPTPASPAPASPAVLAPSPRAPPTTAALPRAPPATANPSRTPAAPPRAPPVTAAGAPTTRPAAVPPVPATAAGPAARSPAAQPATAAPPPRPVIAQTQPASGVPAGPSMQPPAAPVAGGSRASAQYRPAAVHPPSCLTTTWTPEDLAGKRNLEEESEEETTEGSKRWRLEGHDDVSSASSAPSGSPAASKLTLEGTRKRSTKLEEYPVRCAQCEKAGKTCLKSSQSNREAAALGAANKKAKLETMVAAGVIDESQAAESSKGKGKERAAEDEAKYKPSDEEAKPKRRKGSKVTVLELNEVVQELQERIKTLEKDAYDNAQLLGKSLSALHMFRYETGNALLGIREDLSLALAKSDAGAAAPNIGRPPVSKAYRLGPQSHIVQPTLWAAGDQYIFRDHHQRDKYPKYFHPRLVSVDEDWVATWGETLPHHYIVGAADAIQVPYSTPSDDLTILPRAQGPRYRFGPKGKANDQPGSSAPDTPASASASALPSTKSQLSMLLGEGTHGSVMEWAAGQMPPAAAPGSDPMDVDPTQPHPTVDPAQLHLPVAAASTSSQGSHQQMTQGTHPESGATDPAGSTNITHQATSPPTEGCQTMSSLNAIEAAGHIIIPPPSNCFDTPSPLSIGLSLGPFTAEQEKVVDTTARLGHGLEDLSPLTDAGSFTEASAAVAGPSHATSGRSRGKKAWRTSVLPRHAAATRSRTSTPASQLSPRRTRSRTGTPASQPALRRSGRLAK
ncbi:hypothetical protein BJ165DRAFT_1535498 [Panaeolus papilionaceus]|nr:hypothetical protein BJ165DRAFT_1535498 [Panaeolus papilionaceus]